MGTRDFNATQRPRLLYWGSDEWTLSHQWYGRHVDIDASAYICQHYLDSHSNNQLEFGVYCIFALVYRQSNGGPLYCEWLWGLFHVVDVSAGRVKLERWACHYQHYHQRQATCQYIGCGSRAHLYRRRDERSLRCERLCGSLDAPADINVSHAQFNSSYDSWSYYVYGQSSSPIIRLAF
ncbi:uncharacterized protein PpBr36_09801 [Pyricularia pennisetigena]|uniref:uncharacterized protein n=1 Tax=Pyricularia pennisetigena TaxID=1578925 RepID=UPI00114F0915|nr:uncharacterized protein PpBr36_09801 [Pyricularia pennisetigena]TLS22431.1 hypothetical protein PpBr36_09801 [Pyricularia pennisetigena]